MASVQHQYILVGIETDPTRYYGENASRPVLLDRTAAEQVLAHLATDLTSLFPAISLCTLTMAGALFDQTQLLRPGLLVYQALETLQHASNPGDDFQPRLLSIGARKGHMPLDELQPFEDIPLGLLQVLPVLVSGPADDMLTLAEEMEHRFLEQGQLSAHSAKGLESQFGISLNHARFMTITDLNALLRLQLEHYGFLPLWELLDTAIHSPEQVMQVTTAEGLNFEWRDSAVPGMEDVELGDTFLLEESTVQPRQDAAAVTEHHADDLGTVAVTVVNGARQINFYPLLPDGLNDLHRFIRKQGFGGDVAFSSNIICDMNTRQLIADTLPG